MSIFSLANKRSLTPVLGFIALGLFILNFYVFLTHLMAPKAEAETHQFVFTAPSMHVISGVCKPEPTTVTIHTPFEEKHIILLKNRFINENERQYRITLPQRIELYTRQQMDLQEQAQAQIQLQQAQFQHQQAQIQNQQAQFQQQLQARLEEIHEHSRRHRRINRRR